MTLETIFKMCVPIQVIVVKHTDNYVTPIYEGTVEDLPTSLFSLRVVLFYTTNSEDVIYIIVS